MTPQTPTPVMDERDARINELLDAVQNPSFTKFTRDMAFTELLPLIASLLTEAASLRESVRVLTERAEKAEKAEVGVCEGCGASRTNAELKAGGFHSCCPERKMLTAKQWAVRAETAEARVTALTAQVEGLEGQLAALRSTQFADRHGTPEAIAEFRARLDAAREGDMEVGAGHEMLPLAALTPENPNG